MSEPNHRSLKNELSMIFLKAPSVLKLHCAPGPFFLIIIRLHRHPPPPPPPKTKKKRPWDLHVLAVVAVAAILSARVGALQLRRHSLRTMSSGF